MIVILTTDKHSKAKISKDILAAYRDWFLNNPDKWILSYHLESEVGYSAPRKYVNKLRNEGLSIISSNQFGYKLTNDKEEIKLCYEQLRNRALIAITACKAMRKNLNLS